MGPNGPGSRRGRRVPPGTPQIPWLPADQAKAQIDALNNLIRHVELVKRHIHLLKAPRKPR